MPTLPSINELLHRFLAQTGTHAETTVFSGGVEAYDVGSVPVTDPVVAWSGAGGVGALPAGWSEWVTRCPSLLALPWAAGYIPQQVREWAQLGQRGWQNRPQRVEMPIALERWINDQMAQPGSPTSAVAAGLWRQAGHAQEVAQWWQQHASTFSADLAHEPAAAQLAVDGDWARAAAAWANLPASGPVCFNRGLAALVQGDRASAVTQFTAALSFVAAGQPWHHLAQVYRLVAGGPEIL